jgi:hypothetical protein
MDVSQNRIALTSNVKKLLNADTPQRHEKYNTEAYKDRINTRNINSRRILLLLEYRCMGKIGLRQNAKSLLEELGLISDDMADDDLHKIEAMLDHLKGLGFIDIAEESKYRMVDAISELLKQKTYGVTVNDDIVLTFRGSQECEILQKPWFFRYTDRTIQHVDNFSSHTGIWLVLAAISLLGYFVSL